MKISIIYGNPDSGEKELTDYLNKLSKELEKKHEVDFFRIEKMNIHFCTGCWSCWWKTPGVCSIKDDAEIIHRSYINSDFIIFASPLIAGFISSSLKKITDRLIVLLHPYLIFINGESHHLKRYDKYPEFGIILKKEADTDEEDLKIVKDIYDRFAINFHCKQKYIKLIDEDKLEDVIYETDNI